MTSPNEPNNSISQSQLASQLAKKSKTNNDNLLNKELFKNIEILDNENNQLKAALAELQQDLKEKDNSIEESHKIITKLKEEYSKIFKEYQNLEQINNELSHENDIAQKDRESKFKEEINKLQSKNNELVQETTILKRENTNLKNKLVSNNNVNVKKEQDMKDKDILINDLKERSENWVSMVRERDQLINELNTKINELNDNIARKDEQLKVMVNFSKEINKENKSNVEELTKQAVKTIKVFYNTLNSNKYKNYDPEHLIEFRDSENDNIEAIENLMKEGKIYFLLDDAVNGVMYIPKDLKYISKEFLIDMNFKSELIKSELFTSLMREFHFVNFLRQVFDKLNIEDTENIKNVCEKVMALKNNYESTMKENLILKKNVMILKQNIIDCNLYTTKLKDNIRDNLRKLKERYTQLTLGINSKARNLKNNNIILKERIQKDSIKLKNEILRLKNEIAKLNNDNINLKKQINQLKEKENEKFMQKFEQEANNDMNNINQPNNEPKTKNKNYNGNTLDEPLKNISWNNIIRKEKTNNFEIYSDKSKKIMDDIINKKNNIVNRSSEFQPNSARNERNDGNNIYNIKNNENNINISTPEKIIPKKLPNTYFKTSHGIENEIQMNNNNNIKNNINNNDNNNNEKLNNANNQIKKLNDIIINNNKEKETYITRLKNLEDIITIEKNKNSDLNNELQSMKMLCDDLNKKYSVMKNSTIKMNEKKNIFAPQLFIKLFFKINNKIFSSSELKKYYKMYNYSDIASICETFKKNCDILKKQVYETHFEIETTNTDFEESLMNSTKKFFIDSSYKVVNEKILKLKKLEFDYNNLGEFVKNYLVAQEIIVQLIFKNNTVIQFEPIEKLFKIIEDCLNFKIDEMNDNVIFHRKLLIKLLKNQKNCLGLSLEYVSS